jgi:hypothetical protein
MKNNNPRSGWHGKSRRKQMNFRPVEDTYEKFICIHESMIDNKKTVSMNDTMGQIIDRAYGEMFNKVEK